MKIVKSYSIQMSYDVSDSEKRQAEQALLCFDGALKSLRQAADYMNIMRTPFKDNPDMDPNEVMKARAAIRRFRDKAIENFNSFKEVAFNCVNAMQLFASDTQSVKLMKSLISSIDDLEAKVNSFSDVFEDLQSKDFPKTVVSAIEDIQQQCEEVEEIIDERIKKHIQDNILAVSWVDSISKDLQLSIDKQTPLVLDLFNKRQKQLNDAITERSTVGN